MFFGRQSTYNKYGTWCVDWKLTDRFCILVTAGGELFMQLEREGIFMEDTAWWVCLSDTGKAWSLWPGIILAFSFPLTN